MKYLQLPLIIILMINATTLIANEHLKSKYAGHENRKIKSLSEDDITELLRGGGWGLAKAAELNGVPGPSHILEMAEQISLGEGQKQQIEMLFKVMQTEAKLLGKQLVGLEGQLNDHFANGTIDQQKLETLVYDIEKVRASLRIAHLSAHLKTPQILSKQQINLYNKLRGYAGDPCKNVPEGHHAEMWKKHNNCN